MNRTLAACFAALLLVVVAPDSHGALTPEQVKALPPPASRPVDFKADIKPIFEASCIRCHGRGRDRGGFQIDSRQSLLKGGDTGPAALTGNSAGSYLIELVSGLNPDEVMPKKGKKLTPEEVGALRAWIDQGLPWDPEIGFGPIPPQNLEPRWPKMPVAGHENNPVDRFMDVYFEQHHVSAAAARRGSSLRAPGLSGYNRTVAAGRRIEGVRFQQKIGQAGGAGQESAFAQ
jgi:mono/diheme cytochrome c family protein